MTPAVAYRPAQLELRINGYLFPMIWLATFTYEKALRYAILVEDPVFGRFEVSSNMIVEWKSDGRWYQTKPQLVVEYLVSGQNGGHYGTKAAGRGRGSDGSGHPGT